MSGRHKCDKDSRPLLAVAVEEGLGKAGEQALPGASGRRQPAHTRLSPRGRTPDLGLPGLKMINVCCFQPLSLCRLVTAATGN